MELKLYFLLGTRSKRALLRKKYQRWKNFSYNPRPKLLKSLSEQTGMTISEIDTQLRREREFLLKLQSGK